ncbi:GNAT family N-acetyltransferase [bacterium]|nr:GNAT family N-acetyltransferase [bacterium]
MADITVTNIVVHAATMNEIEGIQALAQSIYRRQYSDTAQADRLYKRAFSEASLQRAIASPSSWYYTARRDETVLGLFHFGAPLFDDCQERKEIYRLFVHPDATRQGIGGSFLAAMVALLTPTIVNEVIVYQPLDNAIGRAFYEKYGFVHDPLRDKDNEGCWVKALK